MPIFSTVGRNDTRTRLQIAGVYALLIAGAVTMIYPFLLLVAGSTKSQGDASEQRIVPRFLLDDQALWSRYLEGLFNESIGLLQACYHTNASSFDGVAMPTPGEVALLDEWRSFLAHEDLPPHTYALGFTACPVTARAKPANLRAFTRELKERFRGDIEAMNREFGITLPHWAAFKAARDQLLQRGDHPRVSPLAQAYAAFKSRPPIEHRVYMDAEGFFVRRYLANRYARDIEAYNQAHDTTHRSYDSVRLDRTRPGGPDRDPAGQSDWDIFIRETVSLWWIRAEDDATPGYREFLVARHGSIDTLNRYYGTDYRGFDEVPLVREPPPLGMVKSDWDLYLKGWKDPGSGAMHQLGADHISVSSVDTRFRDYLVGRFGTVAALNAALDLDIDDWGALRPPQRALHGDYFARHRGALKWEFATRNFLAVTEYLVVHGRGLVNTAIYCILAVLGALLVNPPAAYALSRFRPPSTYKMLLFMMLTMAFPPMVTQIPLFLMLRSFGLLNTYWALVLPGLAHGYSIFLLKGFFDSLPSELYENAQLDGAGEFTMFWQITMTLSKPILAVVALTAFTAAYSNFMFALLICQDQSMWTLTVWLYQLQQEAGTGIVYASLLVAAIPTFVIFAFCQNIIMRGIVVPMES